MIRKILLARPHPFIVSEMKPLLLQAGFEITGITHDEALTSSQPATFSAAVISLAVVSPVSKSPQQVLSYLKMTHFGGKFIFAGLIPFERVANNLSEFLKEAGWQIEVHAISSPMARHGRAVYMQQCDLAMAQSNASRDFLAAWV